MEFAKLPNEYDGKENKIASKMLEVLRLALEINPPEIKGIGKKKTAVFVEWMPHVSSLDVRIFKNGWTENNEYDEMYSVYADWEEASEELDKIISRLYEIKEEENDESTAKDTDGAKSPEIAV